MNNETDFHGRNSSRRYENNMFDQRYSFFRPLLGPIVWIWISCTPKHNISTTAYSVSHSLHHAAAFWHSTFKGQRYYIVIVITIQRKPTPTTSTRTSGCCLPETLVTLKSGVFHNIPSATLCINIRFIIELLTRHCIIVVFNSPCYIDLCWY